MPLVMTETAVEDVIRAPAVSIPHIHRLASTALRSENKLHKVTADDEIC